MLILTAALVWRRRWAPALGRYVKRHATLRRLWVPVKWAVHPFWRPVYLLLTSIAVVGMVWIAALWLRYASEAVAMVPHAITLGQRVFYLSSVLAAGASIFSVSFGTRPLAQALISYIKRDITARKMRELDRLYHAVNAILAVAFLIGLVGMMLGDRLMSWEIARPPAHGPPSPHSVMAPLRP